MDKYCCIIIIKGKLDEFRQNLDDDLQHLFAKTLKESYEPTFENMVKHPFNVNLNKNNKNEIEISCVVKPNPPKKWLDSCLEIYDEMYK